MISAARADQLELPENVNSLALSDSLPTAFSPIDFEAADFQIEPADGKPDPNIQVRLGEKSLQWVRVANVLVLPRAFAVIQVQNAKSGIVQNAKYNQTLRLGKPAETTQLLEMSLVKLPFQKKANSDTPETMMAEMPILLMSGKNNPIDVEYTDLSGHIHKKTFRIKFKPRTPDLDGKVLTDISCSPYAVDALFIQAPAGTWAYIGCRQARRAGDQYKTPTLDLIIYWDDGDAPMMYEGVKLEPSSASIWTLRQRTKPGTLILQRQDTKMDIKYFVPEQDRRFFLGVGIGPYQYQFQTDTVHHDSISPLVTGYWSFFLNETNRAVGFMAAPISSRKFADLGFYLSTEQLRALDEHFSLNLLLGGHGIGFTDNSKPYFKWSLPQGFEVIYRDFFFKRKNLSAGMFYYPNLDGRLYYNMWVRFGTSGFFIEANYIAFREQTEGKSSIYSRAAGVSIGFPIARMF